MIRNKVALACAATLMLGASVSIAQHHGGDMQKVRPVKSTQEPTGADKEFMNKAAMANNAEIEWGKLATQKASSMAVKRYGHLMVKDHSEANFKLKEIAVGKKVFLPEDVPAAERNAMNRIGGLSGAAFDKAFMAHMVKAHEAAVALFSRQAKNGKDPDLKNYAVQTLPHLRMHLKSAKAGGLPEKKAGKRSSGKKRRGG